MDIKSRIRVQAAQNNRSTEEEARSVLRCALLTYEPVSNLADLALELFGLKYGIEVYFETSDGARDDVWMLSI